MQRPPPIPILNRNSLGHRTGGNILNSVTPCKEYHTHDINGKLKYCIEVDLQGYPQESIQIVRQSQDVIISLNYEEIKPTGEKYKQEFKREIQFPQSADLDTLKCTLINKNTLLLDADVHKRDNSILKTAQISPSPRLRTSFLNETRERHPSISSLQTSDIHKSFRVKENNSLLMNRNSRHPPQRSPTHYTANSFSRHESIRVPVRVDINQHSGQPSPASVQPIRVEVLNHSPYSKQYNRHYQVPIHSQQYNHNHNINNNNHNNNNHNYYHHQSEFKKLNTSTFSTAQRPLHIHPVSNISSDENTPTMINSSSTHQYHQQSTTNGKTGNSAYINATLHPISHTVNTNNTNINATTNNNSAAISKSTKFYTQNMKVGKDVKPEDLNIHLKNGVLTIMIRQKGKNIENYKQTKIAREFLHEHTIPINVDQNKLIAKLDNGILTWEAPYTTVEQIDIMDNLNSNIKCKKYPIPINR
ncbi:unnamed protein product [Trichobilharzia regenti]|nr:unnamed protein product [Trichobilharzia regenti]